MLSRMYSMTIRNPMISNTQMIHVASATSFVPLVSENTVARMVGTMKPAISAPRLSFGYSSVNRLARYSMASR